MIWPRVPLWWALALAATAGLLLDASFPALGWWPLAFVACSLALLSLIGRTFWGAVAVGTVFGAAFYFPHVSWAASFLGEHPMSWVPWVALAGAEVLLMGALSPLIAFAYRLLPRRRGTSFVRLVGLPLLVAGAWMSRELILGGWPYGGFPWGRLGMSQSESPIAPVASWIGVSGLGFLMVAFCATAIEALACWRGAGDTYPPMETTSAKPRRGGFATLPAAVLLGAMVFTPLFPTAPAGTIRIGAAQGNGPAAYIDERDRGEILDSQLTASEPLSAHPVDVVLWPEGSVDSDPLTDEMTARILRDAAGRFDAPILLNAASRDGSSVFNTSFVWTEEGAAASHSKRHPVPFGEYVPDRWLFDTIAPDLVGLLQREYAAGTNPSTLEVADASVGLAICFDVAFDDVIQEGALSGAQVFVFQTNNADFRDTDESLQQLAFARMRAIETGRSVVNLSTTGSSQIIGFDGATLRSLPVDDPGLIIADVDLRDGLTPAVALGSGLQKLMLEGTLLALVTLSCYGFWSTGSRPMNFIRSSP